jgi:hypothetical protein
MITDPVVSVEFEQEDAKDVDEEGEREDKTNTHRN